MSLVTFGPISRVGSKNACGVARVGFQEPPEPCTTLKATWTLCVLTDHRTAGGVAKVELAKKNVVSIKGLGVILSTSETLPTLENQHPTIWHGPATQPLAVGDATGSGATTRTEAPQALTWLGEPRRPRASPAGTRHRRPSPHPTVLAAPRALAHPGSARRCSPRGTDGRRRSRATRWATRRRRAVVKASWRGGTAGEARQHAAARVWPAGAAPCPPGSWPSLRSCGLPSGLFPSPPMPCPPRPLRILVVDLGRHHSMRRRRLTTPMPMDRAAHSGKRAWPWGTESGHARGAGRVSVWRPFPSTKEPYRLVNCSNWQRT
jgi:hypothetical protein